MTDTRPPELKVKTTRPMSVWRVQGSPLSEGGALGYHRGNLFLMPLTADSGAAVTRFIEEANEIDDVEYKSAKIELVHFLGWVRVPLGDPWSLPLGAANLESLITETAEAIDKLKETLP